jgi:putative flippase GtrA
MIRKIASYGFVGAVSSLVYLGGTVFFVETVHMSPTISSGISYVSSFLFSFFANHHFVFKSKKRIIYTILQFSVVSGISFLLTISIMYCTVRIFHINYFYGVGLTFVVIPTLNFLLNSIWTFRGSTEK